MLGSINLSEFVINPFSKNATFDYDSFVKTVKISTKALNNILDEGLPLHPLQEQRDSVRDWRQIGLGIFGLADMLIKMGLVYGEEKSLNLCGKIGFEMANSAIRTSSRLAKEHGSFPKINIKEVRTTEYFIMNTDQKTKDLVEMYGLRNSQLLTCAPTGTLSTMLGVSGGLEPIFANYYTRKTESLHNEEVIYKVYTPIVKDYMEKYNILDDADLPNYFITSEQIKPLNRIEMQATWQDCIDASISSTINLPNSATVEDVEYIYKKSWEYGLKGVTVYRAGCKREGILIADTNEDKPIDLSPSTTKQTLKRGDILCVSDDLLSFKRTIVNGCGKFYIHTDFDEFTGEPLETFIEVGSGGGCERNLQFISRLMSLLLRAGVPVEEIVDQARSIRPCKAYTDRTKAKGDTSKGVSCPSAIGHALIDLRDKINDRIFNDELEDYEYDNIEYLEEVEIQHCGGCANSTPSCPECGEPLIFEGGCSVCRNCGHSKCD